MYDIFARVRREMSAYSEREVDEAIDRAVREVRLKQVRECEEN